MAKDRENLDYDQLFPGRFMKSGEFQGRDVTLTITGVTTEDLPQDKGGVRTRGIISFAKTNKSLVLNRTNGECLKALFGRAVNDWIGKRVTLFPAPFKDSFTGEVSTAIRVRGSPELAADKVIEVRLPRKKPFNMTMKATGKGQRAPVQAQPEPAPEPEDDDAGRYDEPAETVSEPPAATKKPTPPAEKTAPAPATKSTPPATATSPAPAKRGGAIDVPF